MAEKYKCPLCGAEVTAEETVETMDDPLSGFDIAAFKFHFKVYCTKCFLTHSVFLGGRAEYKIIPKEKKRFFEKEEKLWEKYKIGSGEACE